MVADTVMQTREEGYIANGQDPSLVAFSRAVLAFSRGLALSVVQRKTFTQIFEKMDANSDGALDVHELHAMLCQLGVGARVKDAQEMIEAADTDGNGTVEIDEFLDFMSKRADSPDWELWWQDWLPKAERSDDEALAGAL